AVNKDRRISRVDEPAPRAFANEGADFAELEHIRHQIATGAGHLVYDHYLRSPNARGRTGKRIPVAGDIIKVAVKISLQHVDDVISSRTAAIVPLVDHCTLLVLLREVIAVKARIAGLTGIWQVNVRELAAGELVDKPTV